MIEPEPKKDVVFQPPISRPRHRWLRWMILIGIVVLAITVILLFMRRGDTLENGIPGEERLGTPPPSLNDDPTKTVLDNGQERLYMSRAIVDGTSGIALQVRIPSSLTTEEGTFIDYTAKSVLLDDDTEIFWLVPDSTALNGVAKRRAVPADIVSGSELEIYSHFNIVRVDEFPARTIYILK